ncbi:aldehyde dehydrogenase [uncultured Roseobacter sp.]|uniref:aldehyde dehydrogenase family protein n=1 Tax=uncultured Roseobacter sp. TaxID=114847 RepID=UPI002629CD7A|nr:aldehyde dehydrogenase family protein [uncultured Roseobacter sp.]
MNGFAVDDRDRLSPVEDGQLYIDGKWRESASGKRMDTVDPTTEAVITSVAKGDGDDVNAAIAAARRCTDEDDWSRMPAPDRHGLMITVADIIERHADEFARCETLDMGKPVQFARSIDAVLLADLFRFFGSLAADPEGAARYVSPPPDYATRPVMSVREPVGVVAAITPFNFPLLLAASKIAPAMATGNAVVHKPASSTPLSAIRLAMAFEEAGVPKGVYNLVTGPGAEIGDALVESPDVDKIAFTGSTGVGKGIIAKSADTVKKVTMELGGKSAHIIFADADMDVAIQNAIFGIFYNKGEICTAGSRLLVERKALDTVLDALVQAVSDLIIGDPLHHDTFLGPMADKGQLEKVESYVKAGREAGADLRYGGERVQPDGLGGKGWFHQPTIFLGRNDMAIAQEEIFGPVLTVIPFEDEADAIRIANDTAFGLASGVQTSDMAKALRVASALKAGTCWINSYNYFDVSVPFGGVKQSGFGRECGREALENYTQMKSIWLPVMTGAQT